MKGIDRMKIKILKYHGSGNDFILIDEMQSNCKFDDEMRKEVAVQLCNRKESIGADGILYVVDSENCDAQMRIINSDGSEPEMCGNGLRCLGRYVIEKLNKDIVKIQTMKQDYIVKKVENFYKNMNAYEITLGNIELHESYDFKDFENMKDKYRFKFLTISNPHAISIVDKDDIFTDDIESVGELANKRKDVFKEGVNVSFVTVIDEENIYVRTFERGVGLTKSCGTGMVSATTAVCLENDQFNSWLNVYNDGGMVKIFIQKKNIGFDAKLLGNATNIFRGELEIDEDQNIEVLDIENNDKEEVEYENFFRHTRKLLNSIR